MFDSFWLACNSDEFEPHGLGSNAGGRAKQMKAQILGCSRTYLIVRRFAVLRWGSVRDVNVLATARARQCTLTRCSPRAQTRPRTCSNVIIHNPSLEICRNRDNICDVVKT